MTVQTASGTSLDFLDIPSWVKRITVMFAGVSTNGTSPICIQIGTSSGLETTNYFGGACNQAPSYVANTVGFNLHTSGDGSEAINGIATLVNITGNTWIMSAGTQFSRNIVSTAGGNKALSDTLTRVRVSTVIGTQTFDAGTINVMYE
jgi:hypothetical protein